MRLGRSLALPARSAAAVCFAALAVAGCAPPEQIKAATAPAAAPASSSTGGGASQDLPKVTTTLATKKPIAQKTEQPGRIEAFQVAPLFPRATGYVQEVLVDIGDRVQGPKLDEKGNITTPGQPLIVISAPDIEEQLHQAQASLKQAEAEARQAEAAILVAKASVQSANALIEQSKADALKSDADVKRWKSEYDRVSSLAESRAVTAKLADEAEQQFRAAEAGRASAHANIRSVEAKGSEAQVGVTKAEADAEAMRARVAVAEAAVRQAQVMVDYLTVRAPFDGTITQRQVDPGRLVQLPKAMEKPLLTVVQADTVRLFVEVPEIDAVLVEAGRKATIRIPSLPGRMIEGTVTRAAWSLDESNRTLRTEFDLPNKDGLLRPGMFAQVVLAVAERPEALVVLKSAVVVIEGQSTCMVVKEGVVEARPVQVGLRAASEVEITSGLAAGDAVISANASAFKTGQRVQAVAAK
jgi:RND family efflux transporter MFP subunit